MYSQDPLSNDQLRQLIESNARAIQGNSESIAQLRQQVSTTSESIIELRQQVSTASQQIADTNLIMREGFQAVQSDIQQLAQFMSQFFQGQANHNHLVDGSLEDHERRIAQVETTESGE